ncbi:hypothetical protein, partial [Isoptericola croceus]|uniref:hypothetical protein n=1 Tax=Isoptericola croceus TaxID=3031406 RepID=UPI0023F64AD0
MLQFVQDDPAGRHSPENPGAGDLMGLHLSVRTLRARAEDWSMARQVAAATVDRLGPYRWSGHAAQGWQVRMLERRGELDGNVRRAEGGADAIAKYLTQIRRIAGQAHPLRERLNEARQSLWMLRTDPLWVGGPPQCSTTPLAMVSLEFQQRLQQRRQELEWEASGDANQAVRALEVLHTERVEADRHLRDRLAELGGSQVAQRSYEVLTARGYSGTELTTIAPEVVATVMGDLFTQVVAADGKDGQVADDLRAMVLAWGDDEAVISALVASTGLGLAGLARGLEALGRSPDADGALALTATSAGLTRLRDTVAKVTHDWDDDEIAKQVEQIGDAAYVGDDTTGLASGIGYLFGDPHHAPMGEGLTVALATKLDAIERTEGNPWLAAQQYSALRDLDGTRVDDPLARVLSTLGAYPDAAHDWLTDDELGVVRNDYWFGARDSSTVGTGDGNEGVAALLAGALQATGAITGTGTHDDDVQYSVAEMATLAFENLSTNEGFLAENTTAAGSEALARAVGLQWSQFVHQQIALGQGTGRVENPVNLWDVGLDEGDAVHVNGATPESLATVLGVAQFHPEGRDVLDGYIGEYQQQVRVEALKPGGAFDQDDTWNFGLAENHALWSGFVADGARFETIVEVARRDDDAVRDAVSLAAVPFGAIDVGGGPAGAV